MKFEHCASAVVANNKGGKVSNLELHIALRDGGKHQHCWDVSGCMSVSRNGNPFRVERDWMNTDKVAFVHYLSSEICRQVNECYDNGKCNVDSRPIIDFVNKEVGDFISGLN